MMIDPTACVEDGAVIGEGTVIGPYCMIGPDVVIGGNCKLIGHVSVMGHTSIGDDCVISPFAGLGGAPQDLSYRGEPTRLDIGSGCTIREGVTMNVGTIKGGGLTRVGDRGFFMNNSHVGHDCMVGNDVIFATSATLGGHCEIGDHVYIGGFVGGAPIRPDRLAGHGRRVVGRPRRHHSVRACERPTCDARRPQRHRHEAA